MGIGVTRAPGIASASRWPNSGASYPSCSSHSTSVGVSIFFVARLDLAGVALVELGDLAVVGCLAHGPQPRSQIGLEFGVAHLTRDRCAQMRGDQLAVDVLRHRLKRLQVALHMPRERGDPGRDRDGSHSATRRKRRFSSLPGTVP